MKRASLTVALLGLALWCLVRGGDAQIPPSAWVISEEIGVPAATQIQLQNPIPPGALVMFCGEHNGCHPTTCAAQWMHGPATQLGGPGVAYVGRGPFAHGSDGKPVPIKYVAGRNPTPAKAGVIVWVPQ